MSFSEMYKISAYRSPEGDIYAYKGGKVHPSTGTEALYRPYDP